MVQIAAIKPITVIKFTEDNFSMSIKYKLYECKVIQSVHEQICKLFYLISLKSLVRNVNGTNTIDISKNPVGVYLLKFTPDDYSSTTLRTLKL